MQLNFKKRFIKDEKTQKEAIKNIRILEDTTAAHLAAVNRKLYKNGVVNNDKLL